jgi:glycosyltransferase involved in cell wall biosynthesis
MSSIWVWQQTITPHMAHLADALAEDHDDVFYVANVQISARRSKMGWFPPPLSKARIRILQDQDAVSRLSKEVPQDSIHICEGLRGNGLVRYAQQKLIARGIKPWIVMEKVDDVGITGFVKRRLYRQILRHYNAKINGILAIGCHTPIWLVQQGADPQHIFPFAYFLDEPQVRYRPRKDLGRFHFLFVGQLIKRKRVDLLLRALAIQVMDFNLTVIGDGPMRPVLQSLAASLLPNRVNWLGKLSIAEIPQKMAEADCFVLPSRHDGWGVVVSEALMAGTPVICSDACGSAGVVQASGAGGVFRSGNRAGLSAWLAQALSAGPVPESERLRLASWAQALGVTAGAAYLRSIVELDHSQSVRPLPPWLSQQ